MGETQQIKQLLHFYSNGCTVCADTQPTVDKFLLENRDVEYISIDVDSDFDIVNKYSVNVIPTFISKINERIHDRVSGRVSDFTMKSLFS